MARFRLERPLLVGMLGTAAFTLPLLLLGGGAPLALVMAAAFVAGAGFELFGLAWNLAMQENIEDRMLSRAYSYDALGSYAAIPLGQLGFGLLGGVADPSDVMVVAGVAYALIALTPLLSPSVRNLRRPAHEPSELGTSLATDG
jgi:hypothetical protein